MRVRRIGKPTDQYTVVSNEFIRAGIPPAAFQVACYVMSHRDGFRLTRTRIAEDLSMSRNTVARALDTLVSLGYAAQRGDTLLVSDEPIRAGKVSKTEQPAVQQALPVLLTNDAKECAETEQHKKNKRKPGRATTIPKDWKPNEQHTKLARELGLSDSEARMELDLFRDRVLALGTTYKDWDAAFRNWLRNSLKYGPRSRSGAGGRPAGGSLEYRSPELPAGIFAQR